MIRLLTGLFVLLLLIAGCGNSKKADNAVYDAEVSVEDGNFDAAIASYRIALKNYRKPDKLRNVNKQIGLIYASKNHMLGNKDIALYDSSMAHFNQALKLSKSDSLKIDILDNMAAVKDVFGNKMGALAVYDRIDSLAYNTKIKSEAILNSAIVHRTVGNYNEAVALFEKAMKMADDKEMQAVAHRHIGEISAVRGDYDGALLSLAKAIIMFPDNEDKGLVCLSIASVYEYQGDLEKAIEKYEQAINLMEDELNLTDAYNGLGAIHFRLSDYEKADTNFFLALQIAPMNAQRLLNYGFTRLYLGDIDGAFESFNKAVSRNEGLKRTIATSGEIHRWLDDRENASKAPIVREKLNELITPLVIGRR